MTTAYFAKHYDSLRLPLASPDSGVGFRLAQAGAIHAVAAHFTRHREPAIVTMPTGSGKTAVLMASAFVLRASRVLVVTPSQLVREQIAEQFQSLVLLRRIGALPDNIPAPRVSVASRRPRSGVEWEAMGGADVVVATPAAISPGLADVPDPPIDLFDLILIDEAHHSPAPTWQTLLDGFPDAQRVLFTATPFRRDRREIRGRFVYTYDLADAHRDGVFGQIRFEPVATNGALNSDRVVAHAAARRLRADGEAGFEHLLMVRTDSKLRAKALAATYEETGLRLAMVTSSHSLRHVKSVIAKLRRRELDGIICVNMLGEGFDLPGLKVAAVHAPHRSLAATLQFIGRFARTGGSALGPATFLAVPADIEVETTRLYEQDAAWQEIVANLSASRVASEAATRDFLDTFSGSVTPVAELADDEELSLYAVIMPHHVKIFRVGPDVDIERPVAFPDGMEVIYHGTSPEHQAAVLATREVRRTSWFSTGRIVDVVHGCFVVHHNAASGLLFICASEDYRAEGIYREIASQYAASPRPLSAPRLNKVLIDLNKAAFFNIGLRNRVIGSASESYRIVAGSGADRSIQQSDGRLYNQGHVFGRGEDRGSMVTIGVSTASKVWSSSTSRVPQLIAWCDRLATKIASNRTPQTLSNLDYLSPGEEATAIPPDIVAADWDLETYLEPPNVLIGPDGDAAAGTILDLDLVVEPERTDAASVGIVVRASSVEARYTFSLAGNRYFEPAGASAPTIRLARGPGRTIDLLDYLNVRPPTFYAADFSSLHTETYYRAAAHDFQSFDATAIEAILWTTERVDIEVEFDAPERGVMPKAGCVSIHAYLEGRLARSEADVVFYDHGSGEIADFVSVIRDPKGITRVSLYHCKGSESEGGDRVGDAGEVCMQAVKSVPWLRLPHLRRKIRHRASTRPGASRFLRGNLTVVDQLLADGERSRAIFEVVIVQPGFSRGSLSAKLGSILAAANDYLVRAGFQRLTVLGAE